MHIPVLLEEIVQILKCEPGDFFIDGTINGGGHADVVLQKIGVQGKLLGIDWDEQVLAKGRARIGSNGNVILVHGNYADIPKILEDNRLPKADALLLDLGFSSEQMNTSGKGFSFSSDEPLVMTYDADSESVADILRRIDEKELVRVIRDYGEERYAPEIAHAIVRHEKKSPITSSSELAEIIRGAVSPGYERGRIHPATRTFQALRIYANKELENLQCVIRELPNIVRVGGRAVIISFHSLEDRIVKNMFRDMAKEGKFSILTKKALVASHKEISRNPRSRSAKMRAVEICVNDE
ncbi:MAG: 16S rRNA (cytosine(1402)-N(4))-methyltransferase RsmH [Patescibacteria group bacterium]|nr:16S rRNA (cytosine(1402)-N(4))-methyltransferase RsmH [Patescibacteria group bacterium]